MAGNIPWYTRGPANKQVSALIFGGQLVMPTTLTAGTTDLTVKPATANTVNCLGVAGNDANVVPAQTGAPNTYGQPQIDISLLIDYVSVYFGGIDMNVWYSAQTIEGALLVAAANGAVAPFTEQGASYAQAAGDAAFIIGRCTVPGGVPSSALTQAIGGQGSAVYYYGRARIF